MKRLVCLLMLAFGLLAVQGMMAQDTANWTILHYTAVDNNLEGAAFNDYYEMQSAGSGSGVEIVTQLDRAAGYDARFGDWTNTRRYHIERVDPQSEPDLEGMRAALVDFFVQRGAGDAETVGAQLDASPDDLVASFYRDQIEVTFDQTPVEELGEVDMGDPQALRDFIVWGVTNFPAEHYMLVIGSHGGGWRGIGPDEGDGESMLDLPEIDAALSEARSILGLDKFDIVGFDACLMGVTDVAAMLAPHADFVLSSQEVIPSNGWEYHDSIAAMQSNPDWDAFEVAASFVDHYMAYYAGPGNRTKVGLSVVETAQLPALITSLEDFAQVVDADTAELLSALGTARNNSQIFGASLGDRAEVYSYADLRDFMTWFSLQTTISEAAYSAAQEVIAAYDAAVVYSQADARLPRATGLSVYLPSTPDSYAGYGEAYPASAPADLAFWQDYLNQFYHTIVSELDGSALLLEIGDVWTVSGVGSLVDNPVVLFDAGGKGVIDLTYTITQILEDGSRSIVDTAPIAYMATLPTGEELIEYPNELTPSTFTWGVEVPVLSDGVNSVLGLAQASSASGGESYVQGTYISQAGTQPGYLVYDTADLSFIGLLAISGEAPSEVKPTPGDQFIVDLLSISADGEPGVTPLVDYPLTFGVEPFTLTYQPAPSGQYEVGLKLSDLAGNSIYRSTSVDIDNGELNGDLRGYTDINSGVYFQYPRQWGEIAVLANDDGSETWMVGSATGDHAIFVDVFPQTDAAAALTTLMDTYPADYGEITEVTFGGMLARFVEYSSETDSGPVHGAFVSALNEASGSAIVWTVQTSTDEAPTLNDLLGLLDQSVILFPPVTD